MELLNKNGWKVYGWSDSPSSIENVSDFDTCYGYYVKDKLNKNVTSREYTDIQFNLKRIAFEYNDLIDSTNIPKAEKIVVRDLRPILYFDN